jgi:hypothetical protein
MKFLYRFLKSASLYPLLFAVFPILALWANNFDRMRPIEVVLPVTFAFLGAVGLLLVLRFLAKSWLKAGLLTTLAALLFFTYGHVFGMVTNLPGIGDLIGRHRFLGPLWLVLLLAGGFLILKYGKKVVDLPLFLNCTGLALLILTGSQLIWAQFRQTEVELDRNVVNLQDKNAFDPARINDKKDLPDVYLIVLDSYTRHDALLKHLGYDNTPFLNKLTGLGFVIPSCNTSNYDNTLFSMSSTLNMNYVKDYYPNFNSQAAVMDYSGLTNLIRHSLVRKNLSDLGYKTISFETQYPWVEIPDADIYYKVPYKGAFIQDLLDSTEFDTVLSDTSALRLLTNAEEVSPSIGKLANNIDDWISNLEQAIKVPGPGKYQKKYQQIMTSLNNLEAVPSVPGPKFVYLHLSAPHPKTVLGPNGEFHPQNDQPIFLDSFVYLDKRMPEILTKIIQNSSTPPIIILQGDHGMNLFHDAEVDNFIAYYLPGASKDLVYPTITPVNTFRIIFNAYFAGKYPLLEDNSYLTGVTHPLDFRPVQPSCPN